MTDLGIPGGAAGNLARKSREGVMVGGGPWEPGPPLAKLSVMGVCNAICLDYVIFCAMIIVNKLRLAISPPEL